MKPIIWTVYFNEQQLGKEYELQAQNPLTTMQYERIITLLQNRHC